MIELRSAQNRGEQKNEMETKQGRFHAREQDAFIMAQHDAFATNAADPAGKADAIMLRTTQRRRLG